MIKNHSCIYCGTENDLSESDIIPDALTNARITNRNVCRIEHNNKFSDLFEGEVIESLALISNELDVKSSKGKNYAKYESTVRIAGVDYDVSMSSELELFSGRVLKSADKKHLMSSFEQVSKIEKDPSKVKAIDINNIVVEKKVKINLEIYFKVAIFRLAAKIAFEWYCAKNNVSGYHDDFSNIISFITTGAGNNPVSIIQSEELYRFIGNQANLGSHCLFAFQDSQSRISVVVYLFGIVMYRVIVSDNIPEFCTNNLLYQELCTDSSRKEIIKSSLEDVERTYIECITNKGNFSPIKLPNGITCMVPMQNQSIDILLYIFIGNAVSYFKGINAETTTPNETIIAILLKNITQIMDASLLHKKSIKRFVKEHFKDGHEPIRLNPNSSNKKETFMFYILMVIGKSNIKTINDCTLQQLAKETFSRYPKDEFIISNELEKKLKNELLNTPEYPSLLEQGAYVIKQWDNYPLV
ncbi:hypothetical protein [Clostridium gasigenes]|uniref:hypothetical protein n=1 Tax=Clostridium gasigenes TaxID=94869 RepID=UPI00209B73AC|nr:hypothetical protein [Clostridium gasigenes]